MKILVVSDIHGSSYYAEKILEINEKENPFNINVIVFSGFYSFWC